MKKIYILGLALGFGVSLSSCEEEDIHPMGISPMGTVVLSDSTSTDNNDSIAFDNVGVGGVFDYNTNVGPSGPEPTYDPWDKGM